MHVNLDATRALLRSDAGNSPAAACSGSPDGPRRFARTPPSYGAQKAMGELMVYDMTRKAHRRPLVAPAHGHRAAGRSRIAPHLRSQERHHPRAAVQRRRGVSGHATWRTWITSPRSVIANLIIGHEVAAAEFAKAGFAHTRSVNVPGLRVGIRTNDPKH